MNAVWRDVPEAFLEERRRLGLDKKDELWDGVLHMVPPPASPHQSLSSDLFVALVSIAKRRGLRIWPDATGVFDLAGTWRIPDISLSRPEHVSQRGLESAELVVEILSPNDESREKLPFYVNVGVREVWLVEPTTRAIEIFSLVDEHYVSVPPARSPVLGITLEIVDGPLLRLHDGDDLADV